MTPCDHCPRPAANLPCVAVEIRHPRLCDLVDPRHPDYSADYVAFVRAWRGAKEQARRHRASKPRGSLDDAIRAKRKRCV